MVANHPSAWFGRLVRLGAIAVLLATAAGAPRAGTDSASPRLATARPALREVLLTGFTRARAQLPLIAEAQGRIVEVDLEVGERVRADGLFARVDDSFLRLELDENSVQQEQLRARIAFNQREVERYEALARRNNAAAAQLDSFRQTLRDNGHELRLLEVRARILAERLARTRILAPAGWAIVERQIEPGQWVNIGERVGGVADFSTLLLPLALTPAQLSALRSQPGGIALELPDLDQRLNASIYRISPDFDPETRKIAVDLRLDDPPDWQRGGLRALLRIVQPEASGAVLLPAAAVRQSFDDYLVTLADGEIVSVLLLGRADGPDGAPYLRVSAPRLKAGDRVRLPAAE